MGTYFASLHAGKFCIYEQAYGRTVVELLHRARFATESWVCRDVETRELFVIPVDRLALPAVPPRSELIRRSRPRAK